jgi:dTDP-4-amino-4,6-dideoxygalactose transaminase
VSWPGPRETYLQQREVLDAALARVLESGQYILGPEVEAFELEFAEYTGAGAAVGVGSGTDAVEIALRALGIGVGDKVATVSHTAVATVAAIERCGAEPVLADIDPVTMTLDVASLDRLLDAVAGIRAVVPVHMYGHPADMSGILERASEAVVHVVEDCAQAHGAEWAGRQVGTWGAAGAFSCYPTKNLGALGDAGVIACSAELAEQVRLVRQYGWRERYISATKGLNSRLDPLQAAVLRTRLAGLDDANADRRRVAGWYHERLPRTVAPPVVREEAQHAYHQYVVRVPKRDQLAAAMRSSGIPVAILYPEPVHTQPAYAGRVLLDPAGLRETEKLRDELLCLPMHPLLTEEQVGRVCEALQRGLSSS